MNLAHQEFDYKIVQSSSFSAESDKSSEQASYYKYIQRKSQFKRKNEIFFFALPSILTAYFCYDQPAALHNALRSHLQVFSQHNISQEKINGLIFHIFYALLYVGYSIATFVLPVITGGIRDVKGDRFVLGLLGILVILGQIVFTIGVHEQSILIIILGRLLICWGVESMIPIQSSYFAQYFREQNISCILSSVLLTSVGGLVLSMFLSRFIYSMYGLTPALLTGVMLAIIGFALLLVSLKIDQHLDEFIFQNSEKQHTIIQQSAIILDSQVHNELKNSYIMRLSDLRIYPYLFWLLLAFHTLCTFLQQIFKVYCAILPCVNVSLNLFTELLFMTDKTEEFRIGWSLSEYWAWGCLLLPLMGWFFDHQGFRATFTVISSLFLILGHYQFMHSHGQGILLMGFAFSLHFSAIWSCITSLIKPKALGKAYGLIIAFQNFGFAVVPIFLTISRIESKQDQMMQRAVLFIAILPLLITFLIINENAQKGYMLDAGFITVMQKTKNLKNCRNIVKIFYNKIPQQAYQFAFLLWIKPQLRIRRRKTFINLQ